MEKAVCYIRVGPNEEEDALSSEDQLASLQSYCEENDLDAMMVVKDEAIPGTVPLEDRLGGSDLANITENTGVTNIVSQSLDRLFRNALDADRHVRSWREKNIILHIVNLGGMSVQTDSSPEGIFSNLIQGFADLERKMASERTRSAIAVKKANRFVYGATPYGYDQDGNQLMPNEEEQAILESVKSWHAEGWSLRKIANQLNADKVPTKRSAQSGVSAKWYASTVRYLLSNPLYAEVTNEAREPHSGEKE